MQWMAKVALIGFLAGLFVGATIRNPDRAFDLIEMIVLSRY